MKLESKVRGSKITEKVKTSKEGKNSLSSQIPTRTATILFMIYLLYIMMYYNTIINMIRDVIKYISSDMGDNTTTPSKEIKKSSCQWEISSFTSNGAVSFQDLLFFAVWVHFRSFFFNLWKTMAINIKEYFDSKLASVVVVIFQVLTLKYLGDTNFSVVFIYLVHLMLFGEMDLTNKIRDERARRDSKVNARSRPASHTGNT